MDRGIPFKEVLLNGKSLVDCTMACETNQRHYRLYVDIDEVGNCFHTVAVGFISCVSDGDIWKCRELIVEPLFNTVAYFDGVRHLEFNREGGDMAGYIYYPNMAGLILMLEKVKEIELKTCSECEK